MTDETRDAVTAAAQLQGIDPTAAVALVDRLIQARVLFEPPAASLSPDAAARLGVGQLAVIVPPSAIAE